MSSYRDDSNDTATASDGTWMRVRSIAEGTARATASALFALLVVHTGTATASDEVIGQALTVVQESAQASAQVDGILRSYSIVQEDSQAADAVLQRAIMLTDETAAASDTLLYAAPAMVAEQAAASDDVLATRRVAAVVQEQAGATDGAIALVRLLLQDDAQASDWAGGRVRSRLDLHEDALASDDLLGAHTIHAPALSEQAQASDDAFGLLRARDVLADGAAVDDEPVQFGDFGQAWTANTDTWAMSRYAPFTFTSLAVIDGALYATGAGGVYALDGDAETMRAQITTAPMDMSGDVLAHPVEAHLEYALAGTAAMTVTQTQGGGTAQAYTYQLPTEAAQVLTNGRIPFGRGLRGRHFTFSLQLDGQRAYINDLSVLVAPSKRSI